MLRSNHRETQVLAKLRADCSDLLVYVFVYPVVDDDKVNTGLAEDQATALHEAGQQRLIGTDDDVFLDILGRESRAQIQVKN